MANTVAQRVNNRVKPLLDAAASQFAAKGYRAATIRDIAAAIDMLPGSVYYHFSSKHALLLAVYEEGVNLISSRLDDAVASETDPWHRLRKAAEAHLETILDQSAYACVMNRVSPDQVPEIEQELIELRGAYEERFVTLFEDLPLQKGVDRRLLRLMLLGALNWAQMWYRPDRTPIEEIARAFVDNLRLPLAQVPQNTGANHER
ncbi:MAG: TetR/AcrR family transcriptional regulator [Woeseiaceae bacterium]|nr:TetR/AcrR family transcriptional regulator [Woeseiaceae bacterium]